MRKYRVEVSQMHWGRKMTRKESGTFLAYLCKKDKIRLQSRLPVGMIVTSSPIRFRW